MGTPQREEEPGSDEPRRECVRAEREGVPRERGRRGGRVAVGRLEARLARGAAHRWREQRLARLGLLERGELADRGAVEDLVLADRAPDAVGEPVEDLLVVVPFSAFYFILFFYYNYCSGMHVYIHYPNAPQVLSLANTNAEC